MFLTPIDMTVSVPVPHIVWYLCIINIQTCLRTSTSWNQSNIGLCRFEMPDLKNGWRKLTFFTYVVFCSNLGRWWIQTSCSTFFIWICGSDVISYNTLCCFAQHSMAFAHLGYRADCALPKHSVARFCLAQARIKAIQGLLRWSHPGGVLDTNSQEMRLFCQLLERPSRCMLARLIRMWFSSFLHHSWSSWHESPT